jgi:hypothetical protein
MQKKKLAIIVPYRNRLQHLNKFLPYMTGALKDADIFVIEQMDNKPFNRGKLLNIGFIQAAGYDYYALHDVDMLPVKSDYSFSENPTLLATKVQQFGYKMPFDNYFGGVVLINKNDMEKCNGYHNEFWGWGGEDDLFRERILNVGLKISSRECIYNSLPHPRPIDANLHKVNVNLLKSGPQLENGISNCEYELIEKINNHIKVKL